MQCREPEVSTSLEEEEEEDGFRESHLSLTMELLPPELLPSVVAHMAVEDLAQLFDVPVLGPICFNRYYSTVRVDFIGDEDYDGFLEDAGEVIEDATDYTDSVTRAYFSWVPVRRTCVRFMTMFHFIKFCESHQHVYDFNHVIFTITEDFLSFKKNHPHLYKRYRKIDVALKFYEALDANSEHTSFVSKVSSEVNRFDSISESIDLNFLRVMCFLYDTPLMPIDNVFPRSVNRLVLSSLRLNNVSILNPKAFFNLFRNLRNLYLHRVPLLAEAMVYLPASLSSVSLLFLIIMLETSAAFEFPDSIQYLNIVGLRMYSEPNAALFIDLSSLKALKGLSVTDGAFRSLEDLKMPITLKHLVLSGCRHLQDLASIERYKSLISLRVSSCYRLAASPNVFSINKMPPNLQTLRYDVSGGTGADVQESILQQYSPTNDRFYYTYNDEKYLKINELFLVPSSMSKLHISSTAAIILPSLTFPENLTSLEIRKVKQIVGLDHLRLPRFLQELRIVDTTLRVIDGLFLPEKLKVLEVRECKLLQFLNTNLRELRCLKEVSFFKNELTNSSEIFSHIPPCVKVLNLQFNPITEAHISHIVSLKDVNLLCCRFESVDDLALTLPSGLITLKLQLNKIAVIDESFCFPDLIKTLKLEDNVILRLTNKNVLALPRDLEHLELSRNDAAVENSDARLPPNLQYFTFFCNRELNSILPKLRHCQKLHTFFAASTPTTTLGLDLLPSSLKQCDLSLLGYRKLQGNIDHLTNLKMFCFANNSLQGFLLKLPPSLQFIDILYCEVSQLTRHIDCSNCVDLVGLTIDEVGVDEADLVELLREVKKKSPFPVLKYNEYSPWLKSQCDSMGIFLLEV